MSSKTIGDPVEHPVESALSSGQWVDLRGNKKTPTAPLKLLIVIAPSFAPSNTPSVPTCHASLNLPWKAAYNVVIPYHYPSQPSPSAATSHNTSSICTPFCGSGKRIFSPLSGSRLQNSLLFRLIGFSQARNPGPKFSPDFVTCWEVWNSSHDGAEPLSCPRHQSLQVIIL